MREMTDKQKQKLVSLLPFKAAVLTRTGLLTKTCLPVSWGLKSCVVHSSHVCHLTCELLTDTALSVSHSSIHYNNNVYNYKTKHTLKRARSSFKSGCKLRQAREELCDSPALKASV